MVDYVSSISGLSFIDLDLDPEELGGYITWIPPGFLEENLGLKQVHSYLANGCPFELSGIPYFVGKISRSNFFSGSRTAK